MCGQDFDRAQARGALGLRTVGAKAVGGRRNLTSPKIYGRELAERQGFEPWNEVTPVNALAGRRLQPLGHLSAPLTE